MQHADDEQEEQRTSAPRFDPPLGDTNADVYDEIFLGSYEADGTYYDLWYTLCKLPDSIAGAYVVHANTADVDSYWHRFGYERACFWAKHAEYDNLPFWRPGMGKAFGEADKRIRARKLPLRISHTGHPVKPPVRRNAVKPRR